jgi:lipoate-protein ligase B
LPSSPKADPAAARRSPISPKADLALAGRSSLVAGCGEWRWLGRVPFEETVRLQESIADRLLQGEGAETLLLCEHDPVITLGRSARREHVLFPSAELAQRGVSLCEASRGGDVTYHGPGQLVGYPIFRLRRGVVAHFEMMAAGIVSVLGKLGIEAEWRRDCPGVWLGNEKICAFGVHVRRRVTTHGFALNVDLDLRAFDLIVPCGLRSTGVTSIARAVGAAPPLETLADELAAALGRSFAIDLQARDATRDVGAF